jgi:hypothetical protein
MAKISPSSYPLDELKSALYIMRSFNKPNNTELLFTFIKNEVIPRMDNAGIECEKTFESIEKSLDNYIKANKLRTITPSFYEENYES